MVSAALNYRVRQKLEVFYSGGPIAVLPDETRVACACGDEVKIVSLYSGEVSQTLAGDSEPVTALSVSPDGRTAFVASRSLAVRAWDVEAGRPLRSYKGHRGPVAGMDVHPSGSLLATCATDRTTRVWDAEGGFCTHSFGGHRAVVLCVSFVPGSLSLATGGEDGEVRLWDLVTKTCAAVLRGHGGAVTSLSPSADGRLLLSGSRDSTVRLWDARAKAPVAAIPAYEAVEAVSLFSAAESEPWLRARSAPSPPADPRRAVAFAAGGERGRVRVFRADAGAVCWEQDEADGTVTADGPVVALARVRAAAPERGPQGEEEAEGSGSGPAPGSAPGSAPSLSLLSATQDGRLVLLSRPAGAARLATARHLIGNMDEVTSLVAVDFGAASADRGAAGSDGARAPASPSPLLATHAVVATNSEVVRVIALDGSLSCQASLRGHRGAVLAAVAAPLPGALALGGPAEGEGEGPASSSSSSPSSSPSPSPLPCAASCVVATGGKDALVLFHALVRPLGPAALSVRPLARGTGHVGAVSALAWARGRRASAGLAASGGADGLVKLWDVRPLAEMAARAPPPASAPLPKLSSPASLAAHGKDVNALAFSPDGLALATASADRTARLLSLPDLVPIATLAGHRRGVWDVAFSPVERVVATASADATVRLWSAADGRPLRTLEGHQASVLRVAFAPSGASLASTGADGLLKLWAARTGLALASYEAAEDKVWALAAAVVDAKGWGGKAPRGDAPASAGPASAPSAGPAMLLTGSGDGEICVWEDCTAEDKDEAARESLEDLAMGQRLQNALRTGDLSTAARLAFALKRPGSLLSVAHRAAERDAAAEVLAPVAAGASGADLARLLEYARDWNAHPRSCHAAHAALRAIFAAHPPAEILAAPGARATLQALGAYSKRHLARCERILRETYLVDFVLQAR